MKARARSCALAALGMAAVPLAACGDDAPPGPLADRTVTGFLAPTAVLHDHGRDVYLIACQGDEGAASARYDSNGSISRLKPGGEVEHNWIQSDRGGAKLHSPRGMAVYGDVLYVADIDVVRTFERDSGAPIGAIAIPGAVFLTDVCAFPSGELWITDQGVRPGVENPSGPKGALFVVASDGEVSRLVSGTALGQPTAIVARPAGAYLVTAVRGAFAEVDGKGRVTELLRAPAAGLSGLARSADRRWLAASRAGQCVFTFGLQEGVERLSWELQDPGLLDCDVARDRLLVPLFRTGEVVLRKL